VLMEAVEPVATLKSGVHVLAVDDDPSVRQMIADYLGDNDIRVSTLPGGRGVDEAIERDGVDLLILDLKMPGEDGMQIVRRLRERWDLRFRPASCWPASVRCCAVHARARPLRKGLPRCAPTVSQAGI
jgi:CheY-like chemotaxis protein